MSPNGIDAAIRELERDAKRIQEAIRVLRGVSKQGASAANGRSGKRGGRRKLSAAGRKRIAEAARKRWAAFRAANK